MKLFIATLMLFSVSLTNLAAHAEASNLSAYAKAAQALAQSEDGKDVLFDGGMASGDHTTTYLVKVKTNNEVLNYSVVVRASGKTTFEIVNDATAKSLEESIKKYHEMLNKQGSTAP